jgi:hypothetical protein
MWHSERERERKRESEREREREREKEKKEKKAVPPLWKETTLEVDVEVCTYVTSFSSTFIPTHVW